MAADTYDLLTLSEGKAAINVRDFDEKYTVDLEGYITAASQRIVDLCGPVVYRTFTAEVYDGGVGYVELRNAAYGPLAVTTIGSAAEYDSGGVATTLTAEDYATKPADGFLVEPETRIVRRRVGGSAGWFLSGSRNLVFTYTSGRAASTATVPAKFKTAAQILVAHLWRQRGPQAGAYRNDTDGGPMFGVAPFATPKAVTDLLSSEIPPAVG